MTAKCMPRIQGSFNIQKSISVIHHTKKLETKKYIFSIDKEKHLAKAFISHLITTQTSAT